MVVFYAMAGYAQLPVTNWQNTFGNFSGNARVTATTTDASGNVYVAGYFYGSVDMDFGTGEAVITSSGLYDAFVAKYNAFGDFIWVRRIGGTQGDQVNAIFFDGGGNLHVTGFFQGTTSIVASNGTFNLTSAGGADIFMLNFDGAGALIRNFRIGGTGDDNGLAIKSDLNSNVYLVGTIGSANVNFNVYGGSQLISSSGALDGFIAKYDFSYAVQWVQRVGGGTVDDAISDVDIDAAGNAYVVGTFRGPATFSGTSITLTNSGSTDGFISKLNSGGAFLWARKIGSNGSDAINNIRLNGKGAAYIGGHFAGTCNLNPNGTAQNFTSLGNTDIFVAKIDTNLATANWIKPMGGTGSDLLYGMTIDTNENVYTTGQFENTAEFPIGTSSSSLVSGGGTDGFVSKLNSLGNYVWSSRFGGAANDLGWDIEVSKNGNTVIVGGNQSSDAYLLKMDQCNLAGAISGLTNVCNTTSITYSIAAVTGATSYVWTLPSGWTGTSTTNSITVTPATNGGTISVAPVTSCGVGIARSKTIVYGLTAIDDNLVRHWLADSADNNRDRINNFQLTLNNTVKDTDRFGTPNAAYRITGNTGYIGTGANLPTGNTSIAFWYYYQKNGSNNVLIGSNSTTLPAGHPLLLTDNNQERLYPWSNTGSAIGSGVPLTPNTWHHIVLTRNASSFTLYLNGISVATGNTLATSNFDRVGNNRPGFPQPAAGKFDDIRIYSSILTTSQVTNIYNYGSVKSIAIKHDACVGTVKQNTINFSQPAVSYQWYKNTVAVGTNTNTYNNTFALGDSLIAVKVSNNCVYETYSQRYSVSTSTTVNVTQSVCGSFSVGNKTYYKSGIYKDTLVNIAGCDSIVNLNLTITNTGAVNASTMLSRYYPINASDTLTRDSLVDIVSANKLKVNGTTNFVADRFGNPNAALEFTYGTNNHSMNLLQPITLGGNVSVGFWYYFGTDYSVDSRTLLSGNNNNIATTFLGINVSDSVLFSINLYGQATFAPTPLTRNRWYYFTMAFAGTSASVYVNGTLAYTYTNVTTNSPITIIGNKPSGTLSSYGAYDDIRVFNTTLTQTQVQEAMNRAGVIAWKNGTKFCANEPAAFNYSSNDTLKSRFEIYRGNNLVASAPQTNINNLQPADTVVKVRVYTACTYEEFATRITVYPLFDTIVVNQCNAYTYNGKTFNTTGTYYDTLTRTNTCNTIVVLKINLNDSFGVNLNNGLVRYLTLNNSDNKRDLITNQANSFSGASTIVAGRNGLAGGGIGLTGTSHAIVPTTAFPSTNVSVSFWYKRTSSSYTGNRGLVCNGQANGNIAKYLYVNNSGSLYCGINTTSAGSYAGAILLVNTWYHIVYQISTAGAVTVYVNGAPTFNTTGVPFYPITRIGNRADGNEPGVGEFDDIKVYNRTISAGECVALSQEASLSSLPNLTQACQGTNGKLITSVWRDSLTTVEIRDRNNMVIGSDSAFVSNFTVADTLYNIRISRNCYFTTIPHRVTVSTAAGAPTVVYNTSTKRITATSTFNKYVLYRNNVAIDSNLTSGNINYLASMCGNYQAQFFNTGIPCPATSNVVVVLKDTNRVNTSICAGTSVVFNGNNITSAGVYYATYSATQNCDSIVQLTVSIKQPSTASISRSGCGNIVLFGKTYTQSGQYRDTLENAIGCDSVITLNLIINTGGPSSRTFNISACNQYVLNGKTYTQTGTYRDTLIGASVTGCDSILVLNLTLSKNGSTQTITACKSYVFKGNTLTQSGVYYDTLTNVTGCDSIVMLNLTVNTVNVGVTKTLNTLTASETGATYQWINCATNQPISGATAASYTATASGSYKVIITKNSCVDTSICYLVNIVSCNASLSYTNLSNDSVRCKQIRIKANNVTLPITLNISWSLNPNGNTVVVNDSVRVYTDVCPGAYTVKLTDANGCKDSIVFTINEPVGLNDVDANNLFVMYPNPTSSLVELNFTHQSNKTITVTDVQGKVCIQFTSNQINQQIDVSALNKGLYFVRVDDETGTSIKKLIKQ